MSGLIHEQVQERTEEQKLYDAEVLARVKRGLEFLERTHGPGWEDKIDMEKFDLTEGDACVLGQVFGTRDHEGFHWATNQYRDELGAWGSDHGFSTTIKEDVTEDDPWSALQQCWEDVLTPRIEARTK